MAHPENPKEESSDPSLFLFSLSRKRYGSHLTPWDDKSNPLFKKRNQRNKRHMNHIPYMSHIGPSCCCSAIVIWQDLKSIFSKIYPLYPFQNCDGLLRFHPTPGTIFWRMFKLHSFGMIVYWHEYYCPCCKIFRDISHICRCNPYHTSKDHNLNTFECSNVSVRNHGSVF